MNSRIPLIVDIAREARSSTGRSFLTKEQRQLQEELAEQFPDQSRGAICLPWYESRAGNALSATGQTSVAGDQGGMTIGTTVPEVGTAFRNKLVLEALGARVFGGLRGNARFPQARAEIAAEWLSENASATQSGFTFGKLDLSPKRITAWIDASAELLVQGNTIEAFLRQELMAALAEAVQNVMITGAGSGSNQPTGILNTSGIGSVAGGTNGAAPTYQNLADLEYAVTGTGKADRGHVGWLVSPYVRRKLRTTPMFASGSKPIWSNATASALLGSPAGVTPSVPDNLTKGTSNGVCSAIICAEFSELIMGLWGPGVYVQAIPQTSSQVGMVRIIATTYVDGGLRTGAAAAAMTDALCA